MIILWKAPLRKCIGKLQTGGKCWQCMHLTKDLHPELVRTQLNKTPNPLAIALNRYFWKKYTTANTWMWSFSHHQSSVKFTKTTGDYTTQPWEWLLFKRLTILCVEQLGLSYITAGKVNWKNYVGKDLGCFY